MVYVQMRDFTPGTTDLYVADAEGGSPHLAWRAQDAASVGKPSWASDGSHVFVAYSPTGTGETVIARVDTSAGTLTELKDHLGNRIIAYQLDAG